MIHLLSTKSYHAERRETRDSKGGEREMLFFLCNENTSPEQKKIFREQTEQLTGDRVFLLDPDFRDVRYFPIGQSTKKAADQSDQPVDAGPERPGQESSGNRGKDRDLPVVRKFLPLALVLAGLLVGAVIGYLLGLLRS